MIKLVNYHIPLSNKRTRPGLIRMPQSITIHETDNDQVRANAWAHATLQFKGNPRQASWHAQIDDEAIVYVSIPFEEVAWAAGDGKGPGNMTSIHLEMCVNRDGNYEKTLGHTIELVRRLKQQYPSIQQVVQHHHWTGKNCPRYLRSGAKGVTLATFLKRVEEGKSPVPDLQEIGLGETSPIVFNIGQAVRIKSTAKTYATGENIPSYVKGKADEVLSRGSNRVLLKNITSWVWTKDLELINLGPSQRYVQVDGYLGSETIRALQHYFKTPVDGKISRPSLLIEAMQKWLGTPVDGIISEPYSTFVAVLQRRYGTPVDGKISRPSLVVRALQKRLNTGQL